MKCPICGQQLRPGKKDPNYLLCYNCKKKFKAPAAKAEQEEREEQKYSNIRRRLMTLARPSMVSFAAQILSAVHTIIPSLDFGGIGVRGNI